MGTWTHIVRETSAAHSSESAAAAAGLVLTSFMRAAAAARRVLTSFVRATAVCVRAAKVAQTTTVAF